MTQPAIYKEMAVTVYNDGVTESKEVPVVKEKPLTLFVNQTELAEDLNLTVVGFARGKRFTVYSHPERVKF